MSWLLFFLVLLLLAGCDQSDSTNTETQPIILTPTTTPPAPTPDSTTVPITETAEVSSIIVWIPANLNRHEEINLTAEITNLNVDYPNLTIQVESKEVLGQGGILSYLRTGRNVAPRILPDLIVLPTDQLASASTEGLIVPLDNLLTARDQDALFPIGASLGQIEGQWLGYPFILSDMMHAVYDTAVFTQTFPITWTQLIEQTQPPELLFSADGREGGLLLLQLYLSLGGELINESGQLMLDENLLATALSHIDVAQSNDLLAEQMSTLAPSDNIWDSYPALSSGIVFATADSYLQNQAALPTTMRVATIPSVTIPRATGYAFAISTTDSNEQAVVAELLASLIAPDTLSEWSYANGYLPTRADTLASWATTNTAYVNFIQTELERAIPYPVAIDSTIVTSLSQAVYAVITADASPQTAASDALINITQP